MRGVLTGGTVLLALTPACLGCSSSEHAGGRADAGSASADGARAGVVALGKTHLLATSDGGKTWKEIGEPLPFPGANCGTYGFTYSAQTKTFFINHNDCKGVVLSNSIYSAGFDYTLE